MRKGYVTISDSDSGDKKLIAECEYNYGKDCISIVYSEALDDEGESVTTLSVLKNGIVSLNRFGRYKSEMIFEQSKRHVGCYATPFGEMMVGINSTLVRANLDENGGTVRLNYSVDCNNDPVANNELKIKVNLI